jgi:hypothetical protein
MALSNSSLLRCGTALCAIVLTLVGGVTVYTSQLATREVMRYLGPGRYDWAGVLVRSGGEQMERHGIDLSYDFSGEIAMLVAAFGSILAGLMCVAKIGIEERVRSRWNGDGMVRLLQHPLFRLLTPQKEHHIIPPMKLVYTLSYAAASTAFVALTSTFASAIYTRLHQLTVRQTTCHFEMGEQNDAQFKCTPELAVCEISPYLLKHDISEYARARRQEACGQLVRFQLSPLSSRT